VEEILKEVKKDDLFYRNSGGGVTISGGEPFFQSDFLLTLLNKCQDHGIHCAVDTCGYASWEKIQRSVDFIDLVLFDLKHLDPWKHKRYTGKSNRLILRNLKKLCLAGVETVVRVPVIPGFNDRDQDILDIAFFVGGLGQVRRIEVLPYHRFGVPKYKQLGRDYRWNNKRVDYGWLDRIKAKIERTGLEVEIV
jgi:pyruvate formate lyase activating enzyme